VKSIVITGADSAHYALLQGLVQSVRAGDIALGVMDGGLEAEQRSWINERADAVVAPDWDLRSGDGLPGYLRIFDSRIFLPRYFPGYDIYLWIDADAWIQDWSAIDLYVRAAATGALAVVPEVNPAFPSLTPSLSIWYGRLGRPRVRSWAHRHYHAAYGRKTMRELALKPVMNAGVFALQADAPHWAAWEASYREGLARRPDVWINQVALNHAVYRNDLPLHYLPSRCNWTCSNALPKVDRESSLLVEPFLPHDPIGVVHMTWDTKDREFDLAAVDGGTVRRSLRFTGDG